jgi:coatomer subunit beta'
MTLRNKSYGNAMEFVWSQDSSEYAVRDGNMVKIFKNFKEKKTFKPEAGAEGMILYLTDLILLIIESSLMSR